ncbi:hypothetical protein QOT17_019147 [Balamuthia mandrillaris]
MWRRRNRRDEGPQLSDSEIARRLDRELNLVEGNDGERGGGRGSCGGGEGGLSDSGFARMLQKEEEERNNELLARRLQEEEASPEEARRNTEQQSKPVVDQLNGFSLRAYPASLFGRTDLENGNKVVMHESILEQLGDQLQEGPLLFRVTNASFAAGSAAYCGVLDFTSPEPAAAILPDWLMAQLYLMEGDQVHLEKATLPTATFVRLQPLQEAFMELPSPKATLEEALSYHYCTLTQGESIHMTIGATVYEVIVVECQPRPSVWIVETQLDIDLMPPLHQTQLGVKVEGKAAANCYSYYRFTPDETSRDADLLVVCEALAGDPDLYVDQKIKKPNRRQHTWISATTGGDEVLLRSNDPKRQRGPFWIGVRAHKVDASYSIAVLKVISAKEQAETGQRVSPDIRSSGPHPPGENFARCINCERWIPDHNYARHEAFCQRSNFKCTVKGCGLVIRVQDKDQHVHCPLCNALTDKDSTDHWHCDQEGCTAVLSAAERQKHLEVAHSELECYCGVKLHLAEMLVHKEHECRLRPVPCKFCSVSQPLEQLESHQQRCGAHTQPCGICAQLVPLKSMSTHYAAQHRAIYEGPGAPSFIKYISPSFPLILSPLYPAQCLR